jgi:hypothetical protein
MIMKKKLVIGSVFMLLLGSGNVMAGQGDVGIGVKAGTLGAGVEVIFGISDALALRGGVNYIKFDFDATLSDVDYTMEPNFKNATVLLDWHPFSGVFRLTGGFSLNDNKVTVDGVFDRDRIPSQYNQYAYLTDRVHLQGSVDFNSFAPYAGVGWNFSHGESGLGVSCDLGVLFQGAATVSDLSVVSGVNYGVFQDQVNDYLEEQKKEIQDELDKYEYYPVASIMVHYNF